MVTDFVRAIVASNEIHHTAEGLVFNAMAAHALAAGSLDLCAKGRNSTNSKREIDDS